ncbi:BrnT family toxin [Leptolyngbya ohadii]|uniref:BrnT family toxin n=1 Tax=Leptolyngbya ohadii TaxID=1962290 RepID=UPI001CEC7BB4|nr:BrnT family toxin [Leptolyngbya ohadii]
MVYQWNRDKAAANLRKHGIDFADAVSVFSDDLAITIPDERFDEERFITIGVDALARILVVVYTMRDDAAILSMAIQLVLGGMSSSSPSSMKVSR